MRHKKMLPGEDPDYRFSFANERTYLAWIRTSLAITGGCVLLAEVSDDASAWLYYATLVLSLCAAVLSVLAYQQWKACELSMRLKRALPANQALLAVLVLAVGSALAAAAYIFFYRS